MGTLCTAGQLENADGQPNPFRHGLGEAHTSTAVIKSILLVRPAIATATRI